MRDPDYQADLKRLPRRPFLKEQSAWAIALYRFGRRNDRRKRGPLRWIGDRWYWLAHRVIETLTGIKRAGAQNILTYWATEVAQQLR